MKQLSRGAATSFTQTHQGEMVNVGSHEEEWERAQQRLILYLRFLKVPPFEALEIALEALKLARQSQDQTQGIHPVTAAMQALRKLLLLRQPSFPSNDKQPAGLQESRFQIPVLDQKDISRGIRSMPPLNRGNMLPEGRG